MTEVRKINITTAQGQVEVEATIYGQLAVHIAYRKSGGDSKLSNITHIMTGRSLRVLVCNETVHGYAEKLAAFDWDAYVTAGMPPANEYFGERFSELIGIFIDIDNAVNCDGNDSTPAR